MSEICHKGKIVEITPEFTTVEIISESACGSCHAKGLCGVSETESKAVQLPTRGWDDYKVGDEVQVVLKASMGHKAVWLAYMIPLIVLLSVMFILLAAGWKDIQAALSAIVAVCEYYFVLWLFRKKLQNEYIFNIRK